MITTTGQTVLPERIRQLQVEIGSSAAMPAGGQLLRHAVFEFRYLEADNTQPCVGLLMPAHTPTY